MKQIPLQHKVMKYYSLKLNLNSYFASQESQEIISSKTLPARIDALQCFILSKSLLKSELPMFQPFLLKAKFIYVLKIDFYGHYF